MNAIKTSIYIIAMGLAACTIRTKEIHALLFACFLMLALINIQLQERK
jgi:hypothetical protein